MRSESIHPRAFFGPAGKKKNTAEPRSKKRLERAMAGIQKHLEAHPGDGMSRQRVTAIKTILAG